MKKHLAFVFVLATSACGRFGVVDKEAEAANAAAKAVAETKHNFVCIHGDGRTFFKGTVTEVKWLSPTDVSFKTELSSVTLHVPGQVCVDEVVDPVAAAAVAAVTAPASPSPQVLPPPKPAVDAGPAPVVAKPAEKK